MAITFQKQPLRYFNVNEPAIFEFTTDEDLGVNPNDLVADLRLKSEWSVREYTIKNILPKYGTGVFRVDVSEYFKSLLLDNFDYKFNSPNKRLSIEKFSIGVSVHSENGADIFGDEYVFDSGYIFDTTFIFAEQTPNDNTTEEGFYPTIGISVLSESVRPQKDDTKINILAPRYVEFAEGFTNTISLFVAELATTPGKFVIVDGVQTAIPPTTGVSTAPISDAQIEKMYLPIPITTSLNNTAIPVSGISYKADDCEQTLQFRFYTSYGGYSYFYAPKDSKKANRGKSDFINNNFYNQQELQSSKVQRSADYTESFDIAGVKDILLQDLFLELLRSPKIEVLLPRGFTECEVSGSFNLRQFDFEYSLKIDISGEQMTL